MLPGFNIDQKYVILKVLCDDSLVNSGVWHKTLIVVCQIVAGCLALLQLACHATIEYAKPRPLFSSCT
jgi:hypothetical protein